MSEQRDFLLRVLVYTWGPRSAVEHLKINKLHDFHVNLVEI